MFKKILNYFKRISMSYTALRDVNVGRARITKKGKIKYKPKKK